MMLNLVLFLGILWDLDKVLDQTSLALGPLHYLGGQIQTIPFLLSTDPNSRVSPASENAIVSLCFEKELPGQAQGRTTGVMVY